MVMKPGESEFWKTILDYELDDPSADLTFTDRLARENGWTHEFSVRAIIEYKKFLFLICVTNDSLTPSDEVDQVWHLHLLYTRSYWEEFCPRVLKRTIHHGPTLGGKAEGKKYDDWYGKTLLAYTDYFGQSPPEDLWPPNEKRFKFVNFQRVNTDLNWVLKKLF